MTFDPDRDPIDPGSVELLRRFAEGDDAALARLVEKEGARLLPYIEKRLPAYLRRRIGASDILQNTIVDLLDVRERFEDRGIPAFRRMLNVMADLALARAIERERAQKRDVARDRGPAAVAGGTESQDGLAQLPAASPTPSAEVRRGEDRERLKRALGTLSPEDREVLQLVDGEEEGYDAVARRLGITPAAARKRHSRAVGRLRKLLEEGED